MSEFTVGTLFLNDHKASIESSQYSDSAKFRFEELNERWGVILMEDEYLEREETLEALRSMSRSAPLLYFYNAADHGWGYKLFHRSELKASLDVNYELEYEFFLKIAQERFPNEDSHRLPQSACDQIYAEIKGIREYRNRLKGQFKKSNPKQFRLFEVDVDELQDIFELDYIEELENLDDLVDEFKEIVGIEEMEWINNNTDFND